MNSARCVYWQDGDHWLGYFEEYPDCITQGDRVDDLQDNLKDLFQDLTNGEIPGIRKVAELTVP
jgi:predicted RNase H-like HicB family nuclease